MTSIKKIIWEPVNYYYNDQKNQFEDITDDLQDITFEKDHNEEINEKIYEMLESKSVAINTPFGLYDIKDGLIPTKHFEFWLGHTNFNLDEETIDRICKVDGVEVLKIISRYRFILAPGKAFSFSEVRRELENALKLGTKIRNPKKDKASLSIDVELLKTILKDEELKEVLEVIDNLSLNKDDKWIFYMFPNGKYEYYLSSENENFQDIYNQYKEIYEKASGIFYTNVI